MDATQIKKKADELVKEHGLEKAFRIWGAQETPTARVVTDEKEIRRRQDHKEVYEELGRRLDSEAPK